MLLNGYINNCEKSFIKYNGENAYLTGDLGYLKNGVLYFVGRNDCNIKYKGYRINLMDIENNLASIHYIEQAKVIAQKQDGQVLKIVGFVK